MRQKKNRKRRNNTPGGHGERSGEDPMPPFKNMKIKLTFRQFLTNLWYSFGTQYYTITGPYCKKCGNYEEVRFKFLLKRNADKFNKHLLAERKKRKDYDCIYAAADYKKFKGILLGGTKKYLDIVRNV